MNPKTTYARRLWIERSEVTREFVDEIGHLRNEGFTWSELAEDLGMATRTLMSFVGTERRNRENRERVSAQCAGQLQMTGGGSDHGNK